MLKLDKSQDINTIALHLTTTASLTEVAFVYSQSYDLSNGTFFGDVPSTKGKYRIVNISGSELPTPSGQYDIDVYEAEEFGAVTWQNANIIWGNNPYTWDAVGDKQIVGDVLRTIRAWISGSNDVSFTNYITDNEFGTYTTYNS
jgi:hypothetical protein